MFVPLLKSNGKYCLIDSDDHNEMGFGEYDDLDFFYDGFAVAQLSNKWIYIGQNEEKIRLEFDYDVIERFENGIAAVKRDEEWYFINRNGKEITNQGYIEHYRKEDGFIEVLTAAEYSKKWDYPELYVSKFNCGLIDNLGYEIIPPIRECEIHLENNFIMIYKNSYMGMEYNGSKRFSSSEYSFISSFYQNRAIGHLNQTNEIYVINKNLDKIKFIGNDIFNEYDVNGYKNGFYSIKQNGKWAFIDLNGEVVCDFKYDFLGAFINDYAIAGKVLEGKMKYTFLNLNFEEIVPFKFDEVNPFSEGIASFKLNNKWGVINCKGIEIIAPEFSQIGTCIHNFIWVSYGDYKEQKYYGKYGFYNSKGKRICSIIYDSARDFDSTCAIVEMQGKFGLLNNVGKEVTEMKYDKVWYEYNDFYFAEDSDKRFVINGEGMIFTEQHIDSRKLWPL